MNITEEQRQYILSSFSSMKSKEDFLGLLNYAKAIIYGEKAVPFALKHLNYHSNPKANKKRYTAFSIKKKSGAERIIHAPTKGLKAIQKCLVMVLQTVYAQHQHKAATGFVPGKSIIDNAKLHTNSIYVYNIDLKDFFPSIDQARIWGRLKFPPFNLNEKSGKLDLANMIASLCCQEMEVERIKPDGSWQKETRNVLPQGAPTSPTLTNVICQQLDFYLTAVAKRFNLKYSRYADDITFSSHHDVYQENSEFLNELHRIVAAQNFHIKPSKTRLQKQGYRQEVTGIVVNEHVNVPKRYIKQLRMWLYYWEQYGYGRAYTYFVKQYKADKGYTKKGKPNMANVIKGKVDYLKMVKGGENATFKKLYERFSVLINLENGLSLKKRYSTNSIDDTKLDYILTNSLDTSDISGSLLKLKISISSYGKQNPISKLQRRIVIDKGEVVPYEKLYENQEDKETEIDLSKHKPIDVTRFLLNFRSSEGLKFLTHDYDKVGSSFERKNILNIARLEFEKLGSEYVISNQLKARIFQFAFGDTSKNWWFNGKPYNVNWNSSKLVQWVNENPNVHPIKNDYLRESFISPFKKSIEIKAPELEYLFRNKLAEELGSEYLAFEKDLKDLDKANFYTDVDALQVGMGYLIKAIKQRSQNSKKIKVEFTGKSDLSGRKRIIKIIHVGSECNKDLDKKELLQGDLLEAEKAFLGICDWSIVTKSPDPLFNKLNILFDITSDTQAKEKVDEDQIEGFTHILTFYS